jgi:hypothetical protein
MDSEQSGARLLVLELHQDPFSFCSMLDGSEIDPLDLSRVSKTDWRMFRQNVSVNLRRELKSISSGRDQTRFRAKKQPETGASKLVQDNPSFDPVFMKV